MKDKILMLIVGILIGAIITATGFLIFSGNKTAPTEQGMYGGKGNMANFIPDDMDANMIGGRGNRGGTISNTTTSTEADS